jgi:hypothetical protein
MPREMNIAAPPRWAVHDHGGTGLIKCRLVRAIARCIGGEGNNSTPGEVPYARTHVIMASEPRKWGTYDDGSASLQPSIDRPRATTYLATDELELCYYQYDRRTLDAMHETSYSISTVPSTSTCHGTVAPLGSVDAVGDRPSTSMFYSKQPRPGQLEKDACVCMLHWRYSSNKSSLPTED